MGLLNTVLPYKMPSLIVSVFSFSSVNRESTLVNYGHGYTAWFSYIIYVLLCSPWHLRGISILIRALDLNLANLFITVIRIANILF